MCLIFDNGSYPYGPENIRFVSCSNASEKVCVVQELSVLAYGVSNTVQETKTVFDQVLYDGIMLLMIGSGRRFSWCP